MGLMGVSMFAMFCSHANGTVAQYLSKTYTVAQLEAMNLWQKMDGKIAVLGGAEVLNAVNDEAQLEKETDGKGRKIRKSLIPIQISRIQVPISQKKS